MWSIGCDMIKLKWLDVGGEKERVDFMHDSPPHFLVSNGIFVRLGEGSRQSTGDTRIPSVNFLERKSLEG